MSEAAIDLVVSGYGRRISLRSKCVGIFEKKECIEEIPLFRIRSLTIESTGISISSDVIIACQRTGIPIICTEFTGMPVGILSSPYLHATISTRRAQFVALATQTGLDIGVALIRAKISNQRSLLLYASKNTEEETKKALQYYVSRIENCMELLLEEFSGTIDLHRSYLLGIEGQAGRLYWEALKYLFKKPFVGRETRGSRDFINSLINYGYGILYRVVWCAILRAGLEPYAGFIHTDRPGKFSMVLDAIEEFRAPIVDRTILALVNLKQVEEDENDNLSVKNKRTVAQSVLKRLETKVKHHDQVITMQSVINRQSRLIANHLMEKELYKPYQFKW